MHPKPSWNRVREDRPLTMAEKTARYRARNPDRDRQSRLNGRLRKRQMVATYKSERGCESCGIRDPRVLDLHHRDGDDKIMAVSQMICRHGDIAIKAEMNKCRVLCANCHRIEHADEERT